jgi:hypothetical protein
MKYIKLFENYSSSEEDEEYETESIDDLKKLLIDLINKKLGGAMCTLESNPLNENLFTIKSYNSEITSELKCEIKPYKREQNPAYDPEVAYVVYIKNDDFDFEEKEKRSPGIRGPWGFAEANLRRGHFVNSILALLGLSY